MLERSATVRRQGSGMASLMMCEMVSVESFGSIVRRTTTGGGNEQKILKREKGRSAEKVEL
jgi:hypothetical protein